MHQPVDHQKILVHLTLIQILLAFREIFELAQEISSPFIFHIIQLLLVMLLEMRVNDSQ